MSDPIRISPAEPKPLLGETSVLATSWSLAGGVAGGLVMTIPLLTGHLQPHPSLLVPAAMLVVLGSVLGVIHGAILGYLAQPTADSGRIRWGDAAFAFAITAVAFALSMLVSMWLVLGALLARDGRLLGWVALAAAGGAAVASLAWATVLGWRSLEHAYTQWPDHRLGSGLVFGAFVLLAASLLMLRPAIPRSGVQLSAVAAIVVAAVATVWVAAPAIILTLWRWHRERYGQHTAHTP
jgi:hypothetical protein